MKILIVIDMQNDFIDGALGTPEAAAIVPAVAKKIRQYREAGNQIVFTRDTHGEEYLDTQEGQNLPVRQCIEGSFGWEISAQLPVENARIINKPTFGSLELADYVASFDRIDSIELMGLCTDICVISNAMILKAALPEIPLLVDGACCAGVTPESHRNALEAMKMCQISVSGC